MKRWTIRTGIALVMLGVGVAVGYVITMKSLFPTAHGNFTYAMAPDGAPYGNDSPAVSAHFALIQDIDLLRREEWRYVLSVTGPRGKSIGRAEFSRKEVGGVYDLRRDAKLTWDKDAWAVSVAVGGFSHRYDLPRHAP